MDALGRIAQEADAAVVEDAAQAIGAEWDGRRVGSIGDVGCFSFYPTKNLGGAGDGGMATTRRDDLAERLALLRAHGMEPRYYHKVIGINSRLDSFQAAILNVKLAHLDHWTARAAGQRAVATPSCSPRPGWTARSRCRAAIRGRRHVWNQYVIRVPDGRRDALRRHLADANIGSEIYYPLGLHAQECFAYLGYRAGELPETERAAVEVLALPIFPELTEAEQEMVVERIASFYRPASGGHPLPGPKFLKHRAAQARRDPREEVARPALAVAWGGTARENMEGTPSPRTARSAMPAPSSGSKTGSGRFQFTLGTLLGLTAATGARLGHVELAGRSGALEFCLAAAVGVTAVGVWRRRVGLIAAGVLLIAAMLYAFTTRRRTRPSPRASGTARPRCGSRWSTPSRASRCGAPRSACPASPATLGPASTGDAGTTELLLDMDLHGQPVPVHAHVGGDALGQPAGRSTLQVEAPGHTRVRVVRWPITWAAGAT